MRLFPVLCLLLVFSLRVASCYKEKKKTKESSRGAVRTPRSKDFAFSLYRALASKAPGQNVFFSPLSVSISLGMLSLGAGSHTKTQILEGLGLSNQKGQEDKLHKDFQYLLQRFGQPRHDVQLSLGSTLFTDPAVHIRDSFLKALKMLYMSDMFSTNFGNPESAKKQINDYVAHQTKGKIVDLIKDLDSTHVMVMVNYIFFKAKWKTAFSDKNTHQKDFHVTPERTVKVPMMNREDEYSYILDRNISCMVVGIPYQGNTSALFILPNKGKMKQVENGLNKGTLRNWLKITTKRRLDLYLPKFSIEGTYQLEKILPKLNIKDVFTSHADLSGITDHTSIKLSEMMHKAVVQVDEAGTSAAAATGSVMMLRSARPSSMKTEFNRPFLIAIMSDMNLLFLGKVVQP
ncbi:plasma serine protease inhibitor [Psammomys obesus]|uniref:plasma serine protease inhibitor n=1 Tax=Psammomys obesus TaxID=48139 RepID=UPI0024532017|nr:plasma serine protease inhibitor [Psammomys obesus]